jgi:hypothetical protein
MRPATAIKAAVFTLIASGCNVVLGIEGASSPSDDAAAGGGGRAGASAGGAPAGSGGAGAGAGAGGASAGGSGGSPSGSGLLGAPCTERGARACHKPADKLVLLCDGEPLRWVTLELCDGTLLCDGRSPDEAPTTSGSCQPLVPACAGQQPGAVVCEGAVRHVCGPDLVTSETTTCASAQLCQLGVEGPGCAVCLTGEHACAGSKLRECAPDHQSFVDVDDCVSEALCNAGAGQCTAQVCVDGQHRCNGDALEACNVDHSGFDPKQSCGPGLCDQQNQQCDVCVANSKRCTGGNTFASCSLDGQGETAGTCAAPTGVCVGQGLCVECSSAAQCADPPGVCKVATCSGNQCGVANAPDGMPCSVDKICFDGLCVCPGTMPGAPGSDSALCPVAP